MGNYTQENRPMRVDTPLPVDTLLLEGFEAEEGISRPFLYVLDLLSEDPEIDPGDLLRQPVLVTLQTEVGKPPALTHGIARSFVQLDMTQGLARYRAEVVPAFWFLTQTRDCRIFQEKTVLEIVAEVLDESTTVGQVAYDIRCSRNYPTRTYCVQYRESDFNFISRLLEDEGIFYWFEHAEDEHTLVLADSHISFEDCPGYENVRLDPEGAPGEEVVRSFVSQHAVGSFEVTLADYDPLQASMGLSGVASSTSDPRDPVFDYPGYFTELDVGEYRAQLDLERREKGRHRATGSSSCRGFRAGRVIALDGHYRPDTNGRYYLDRLRHTAHSGSFRGWDEAEFHYANEFVALPDTVPYRPDIAARRPRVHGTQTAVVVGKKGEDIWVDEHGRVKVQFHWDRYGKEDENSSCWVRVSQNWAGAQWGGMFVPHVGHEVIVDFLEGDPDRPIITGRVYHSNNTTPLPLPGDQTKSIIRDHGGNEIVMEGKDGAQQIRLFSPTEDSKIVLGAPNAGNIFFFTGGTQVARIAGRVLNEYGADFIENVLGSEFKTVDGATKVERKGSLNKMTMGAESSQNLSAKSTTTVGVEHSSFVGGKVSTSHAYTREVNRGWKKTTTTATSTETVDGVKTLESKSRVEIAVGGAVITIANGVISIDADKVLINGSDKVLVESGGDVKLKPSGKVDIPKGKLDAKNLKEP